MSCLRRFCLARLGIKRESCEKMSRMSYFWRFEVKELRLSEKKSGENFYRTLRYRLAKMNMKMKMSRCTVAPPTFLERNRRFFFFSKPAPGRISWNLVPLAPPRRHRPIVFRLLYNSRLLLQTRKYIWSIQYCMKILFFTSFFLVSSNHETWTLQQKPLVWGGGYIVESESESESVMSCHVMSCHVMSCHAMSCHVMSMSCHVMSCHHVMSRHVMSSCHVMSCHVMSTLKSSNSQLADVVTIFLLDNNVAAPVLE